VSTPPTGSVPTRHLLSVADLGREGIIELLGLAASFSEVAARPIPKVPALRGRTVATVFFEASTRTRLSFELAARRLSADTMTFTPASSSLSKGESLRDTVETIEAMGVDAMVVRHAAAGAPALVSRWVSASVVNAGDGAHEHPTQALLDCFTILEALAPRRPAHSGAAPGGGDLSGLRVAIVGDVAHSRVARSCVAAFSALGASVTLVGPATLLPSCLEGWPVAVSHDLDEVLSDCDVCYLLRLQKERMSQALLPSLEEYRARYGLTAERAQRLAKGALVLHPGPMNRGVEIDATVASEHDTLVTRQVRNGVPMRMAVLFRLLGGRQ
jgi:aspartate carbamoyltransferase catalytic subunit